MIYVATNIEYDTSDLRGLPKQIKIEVDAALDAVDKVEFISDEITNRTGFLHKGFATTPEINE